MEEFKDRLKILRNEAGVPYSALASEFGKTESAIRAWELGRTKADADTLVKLAKYFGCTTDYLLGLSDHRNEEREAIINDFVSKCQVRYDALGDENIQKEFSDFLRLSEAKSKIRDKNVKAYCDNILSALSVSFLALFENIVEVEDKGTEDASDYAENLLRDDILNSSTMKMVQGMVQIADDYIISKYAPKYNRKSTYVFIDQLLDRFQDIIEKEMGIVGPEYDKKTHKR